MRLRPALLIGGTAIIVATVVVVLVDGTIQALIICALGALQQT
jgi:hypothetical protein